jgi:methyl-accepting chemotaxis protein
MKSELPALRRTVDTLLVAFLWLHVPIVALLAWMLGNDWMVLGGLAAVIAFAATAVRMVADGAPVARLTMAVAVPGMVSALVAGFAGNPWQTDLHMYYFACLAVMAAYCDPAVILAAAATTAAHHLLLNFIYPFLVFPGGASFVRVLTHAAILIVETGALFWMTRRIAASVAASAGALVQSEGFRRRLEETTAAEQAARGRIDEVRRETLHSTACDIDAGLGEATVGMVKAAHALGKDATALTRHVQSADAQAKVVLDAAGRTSADVQSVAVAVEQLTASIREIAVQITAAAQRASVAAGESESTALVVNRLSAEAMQIGEVVSLINEIAGRTNLLALNATIEAARAGDAGRGFAVVASEVKNLAAQTAQATTQIQARIAALQAGTAQAVQSTHSISEKIGAMNAATTAVAAAVEEQHRATGVISRSLQSATEGMDRIRVAVEELEGATGASRDVAARVTQEGEAVESLTEAISQTAGRLSSRLRAA